MFRKAFRYRLYPNKEQQAGLAVQFGHARFVYNWALATRNAHYREHGTGIGYYALKRMTTDLKRQPDHVWLKEADSQVLQAKVEDLDRAFANFFNKSARYPRLKKRRGHQSVRWPQRFKFDGDRVYLPKVGWVKFAPRPGCGVAPPVSTSAVSLPSLVSTTAILLRALAATMK